MQNNQPIKQTSPESFPKEDKATEGESLETKESETEELKERIKTLETELKKEESSEKKEESSEKKEEIVKREIKDYLQELQETPSYASPVADRDEVEEVKKFPPSQQVGVLISLVFEKGLKNAISIANNINNPAILDEFHDVLVDRYYQELVEKDILKP
jgi:ATP-dependent 26S proteasome regulatory subunit